MNPRSVTRPVRPVNAYNPRRVNEASSPPRAFALSTVALLFFASGVAGLVYQELWLRLLGLVFGVTVYAASTVLAGFMGGLALGSALGGRFADRVRRPLFVYGVAEVLVGLAALATPVALGAVEAAYVALHPSLPQFPGALTALRFALSIAVLLVPTMLMGATFPLVVRASLFGTRPLGEDASVLYAANTAGGIAGTLLAGFWMIGGLGIAVSFRCAAALNVAVGLAAVLLSRAREQGPVGPATHPESADAPAPDALRRRLLVVFAISGFASLALEVVWFRVLALFLQVTTYAFSIMLAAFLTGIAAGSAWAARLFRKRRDWLAWLVALEILLAVAAALSLLALDRSYDVLRLVGPYLGRPSDRRTVLTLAASFLTLVPATFLMGVAFPVGLRLFAQGDGGSTGARVGRFYAWNVCGSILGALAGGFLLLPLFGSRLSVIVLSALSLGSGLWLATALPGDRRRFGWAWAAAGTAAFTAAALLAPDPFAIALARRHPGERLLWSQEGPQASVNIHQMGQARVFYLDGKHQADDTDLVVRIHREIGALALAVHPHPRKVLVIGLGGGVTAGAVALDPRARVDVVELSRSVVGGAEWFRHVNGDVLRRPNVRLQVDDGRNVLLLTPERYDAVTADIIQPHHAGAGSLYSVEYFRLAQKVLGEGGIMVQWISLRSEKHYELILRTFLSVFPEVSLWGDGSLVVGSRAPLGLSRDSFARRLAEPGVREALGPLGVTDYASLRALHRADGPALRAFVGEGPVLTDDRPLVEYFLSLPPGDRPVDLDPLFARAAPTER
jgi:spermidine synthase